MPEVNRKNAEKMISGMLRLFPQTFVLTFRLCSVFFLSFRCQIKLELGTIDILGATLIFLFVRNPVERKQHHALENYDWSFSPLPVVCELL